MPACARDSRPSRPASQRRPWSEHCSALAARAEVPLSRSREGGSRRAAHRSKRRRARRGTRLFASALQSGRSPADRASRGRSARNRAAAAAARRRRCGPRRDAGGARRSRAAGWRGRCSRARAQSWKRGRARTSSTGSRTTPTRTSSSTATICADRCCRWCARAGLVPRAAVSRSARHAAEAQRSAGGAGAGRCGARVQTVRRSLLSGCAHSTPIAAAMRCVSGSHAAGHRCRTPAPRRNRGPAARRAPRREPASAMERHADSSVMPDLSLGDSTERSAAAQGRAMRPPRRLDWNWYESTRTLRASRHWRRAAASTRDPQRSARSRCAAAAVNGARPPRRREPAPARAARARNAQGAAAGSTNSAMRSATVCRWSIAGDTPHRRARTAGSTPRSKRPRRPARARMRFADPAGQ